MNRKVVLKTIKDRAKSFIRSIFPLALRKEICIIINRRLSIDPNLRYWWTSELLRDFAEGDRNEYHRFLWSHHLAYAASYEVETRYGEENMKESRRMFFSDLKDCLEAMGVDPHRDIRSVLEVGCSLGYQLRYLETDLFTGAETIEGIDIDGSAISRGAEYLQGNGSRIRLICDDMANLDQLLEKKIYDVIICTGTLMYLDEKVASEIVVSILDHCRILAGFSGPAHPEIDNGELENSVIRERDGSFVHNFDSMVKKTDGDILRRRWEGNRMVDGHTIYFVFATKKPRKQD